MPRLSIIIPAYNYARYLPAALDSLLGQICADWEAIIVDDGSTDSTPEIAAVYSQRDARFKLVRQTNRGQAAALNHGLDLATGDWVTTLDADDWYPAESVADRLAYIDAHPEVNVFFGDGYYCDSEGQPIMRLSIHWPAQPEGDMYEQLILASFIGAGSVVTVRRQFILANDLQYDPAVFWCQDWDLLLRMSAIEPFGCVRLPLAYYRLHPANMTQASSSERRRQSTIRAKRKVLESPRFLRPQTRAGASSSLLSWAQIW